MKSAAENIFGHFSTSSGRPESLLAFPFKHVSLSAFLVSAFSGHSAPLFLPSPQSLLPFPFKHGVCQEIINISSHASLTPKDSADFLVSAFSGHSAPFASVPL